MSNEPSSRHLRVPVRFVNGQWEFKLGGKVPAKESADAEIVLDRALIEDKEFLAAMERAESHKVLEEGTELIVSLTIKPGNQIKEELTKLLLPYENLRLEIGTGFVDKWSSAPPYFVTITIGKPDDKQAYRLNTETGGLWLLTRGIEAQGIVSTQIQLPKAISSEPIISLNHAFTKLSEVYEPWRISHTGNIYNRVFYRERNNKWYPLDLLRNEKLHNQEQTIAKELWESFLKKMTPTQTGL